MRDCVLCLVVWISRWVAIYLITPTRINHPYATEAYDLRKKVSQGTYGVVYVGVDKRTGAFVTLKRLRRHNQFETNGFAITSVREMLLMQVFRRASLCLFWFGVLGWVWILGA